MDKNRLIKFILVIFIVLVAVSILGKVTAREKNSLNFLERGVRVVTYPFQLLFNSTSDKVNDLSIDISELDSLRKENTELKKEISRYKYQINILDNYRIENLRLNELLEYKNLHSEEFQLKLAKVVGESSDNYHRIVYLNLGREEGIRNNMPVINHEGLVGKTINVSGNSSQVLLLLDNDSGVGSRIFETRNTVGVAEGLGIDSSELSLIHLPKDALIKEGDKVISSGLDFVFPPELSVGDIVEIIDNPNGFMKSATIKPSVDFSKLEEVFIITNYNKISEKEEE